MNMLKMQPTFTFAVPVSADEAMVEIRNAIESPSLREYAQSAGRCIDYTISKQDQRFWSPHLSVQLSETDSGSSLLGRFSPRPEICGSLRATIPSGLAQQQRDKPSRDGDLRAQQ